MSCCKSFLKVIEVRKQVDHLLINPSELIQIPLTGLTIPILARISVKFIVISVPLTWKGIADSI